MNLSYKETIYLEMTKFMPRNSSLRLQIII